MKAYCLGFIFSPAAANVVLLEKHRGPATARGWNGVGGRVEAQESPQEAMAREALEETGLATSAADWTEFAVLDRSFGRVHCYLLRTEGYLTVKDRTDEPVRIFSLAELLTNTHPLYRDGAPSPLAEGVAWMLAMARERAGNPAAPVYTLVERVL